jgi:hypothetical protein
VTDLNELHGTATDGGGNKTFLNPANAIDGDYDTYSHVGAFAGAGILYEAMLDVDLGTAYTLSGFVLDADANCNANHVGIWASWWYRGSRDHRDAIRPDRRHDPQRVHLGARRRRGDAPVLAVSMVHDVGRV